MLLGPRAREQHKRHFFVCSGSCRPRVTCNVYTVTSDVLLALSKPHAHPAAHGPPAALQGLATPHPTPHPTCTAVLLRCRSGYCLKSAVWSHVLACTWQGRGREGGRPGVGGGRPRSDGDGGRGGVSTRHAASTPPPPPHCCWRRRARSPSFTPPAQQSRELFSLRLHNYCS